MKHPLRSVGFCLGAFLLWSCAASADEFKLKDGTKITGTIVGYEEDSFKVQTSYGFAVVKKDQVLSIGISAPAVAPTPASAPSAVVPAKAPANAPPKIVEEKKPDRVKTAPPALAKTPGPEKSDPAAVANLPAVSPAPPDAAPVPAPAVASAPPKPSAPEPIRENVTGNVYTNITYGFHMFKPPDWDVIAAAPSLMPGAIAAMGTYNQDTYLLVGQDITGKTPAMEMDATEKRLRDILENFRPLGEQRITVSGIAAIEHRFRGSVDDHDWSGMIAIVPHGQKIYTIFGMTRADTDLVQIQENVISRTIASLQFTTP